MSAQAQVSAGGKVGSQAEASYVDGQPGLRADLAYGQAYVDPGVLERFEVELNQIVIVVADPAFYRSLEASLTRSGFEFHPYPHLFMFAVRLNRADLADLAELPGVLIIYHNEAMKPSLDKSAPYTGANVVWNTYHTRGTAVTIMVVDSGVDGTHPDVRLGENLVQNVRTSPTGTGLLGARNVENAPLTDFDGHGTHVAGIAGGTAKSSADPGKYKGVAYGARLVGFAAGITDPSTGEVTFESQNVLEAFNYAIAKQRQYNISIVSNSWGANGDFDIRSPVNIATLQMYKSGLLVVFAAGNEGEDGTHTLNKYSVAPWVLSVAAGDYLNQIARFSSRGTNPTERQLAFDHPDLTAPGVGITAAKASTTGSSTGLTKSLNPGGYTTKSGTSMATPHVSAIAALLLDTNPRLSPDDLMDILTATATPLSVPVWEGGAGYVNALAAYQLALKTKGDHQAFLGGRVKYAGPETGDPDLARDAVTVGYGGAARNLASGSQSLSEFGDALVSSVFGWIFLAGLLLLPPLAFRMGRRA